MGNLDQRDPWTGEFLYGCKRGPVTCPMVENFTTEGHDSMDRGWSPMDKGTDANEVKKGYDLESVRSLAKDDRVRYDQVN